MVIAALQGRNRHYSLFEISASGGRRSTSRLFDGWPMNGLDGSRLKVDRRLTPSTTDLTQRQPGTNLPPGVGEDDRLGRPRHADATNSVCSTTAIQQLRDQHHTTCTFGRPGIEP
jgi:hypothetical protein